MKKNAEFRIKSSHTDLELILSDIKGDYFIARISSKHMKITREVWAYADAYGFAELFEWLASQEKPWNEKQSWESLEGEFKFSAMCSSLGVITFEVEFNHYGCAEEWQAKTQLSSEFGQLPALAKQAREFFGESPS